MAHVTYPQPTLRAPRVHVPNSEAVSFALGGRRISGVLHKISTTGGLARLTHQVSAGTLAQIRLNTAVGPVSGIVELLKPDAHVGGTLQPFKFIVLRNDDHRRLSKMVQVLTDRGFSA